MPAKLPWIQRTWNLDFPVELYPDILERLRGTPARIEESVRDLPTDRLTRRQAEGTWSIQENIGHMLDLEDLPLGRVQDFLSGAGALRAADMSNRKTHDANHNAGPIGALLTAFRSARGILMDRLDRLTDADFARTSIHPRLEVSMRLVDLCLFQADHDDNHLARIRELRREFRR